MLLAKSRHIYFICLLKFAPCVSTAPNPLLNVDINDPIADPNSSNIATGISLNGLASLSITNLSINGSISSDISSNAEPKSPVKSGIRNVARYKSSIDCLRFVILSIVSAVIGNSILRLSYLLYIESNEFLTASYSSFIFESLEVSILAVGSILDILVRSLLI